jgi:2-polyprenyl-3-methyl-5-hydroxy-6-metoxy-1,4-benzoquinol methylase
MSVTQAGLAGYAPKVLVRPIPVNPERTKYEQLWKRDDYRAVSPGEQMAMTFLQQAGPERDAEIIDFGCGTGRGALMLALMGGLRVKMLDFAENCLDPEVAEACVSQPTRLSFRAHDLSKPPAENAPYGYCCDVMEHIPTDGVPKVLRNILGSAQHVFFGISTVPDVMGKAIGEDLHLTVKPLAWWLEQITAAGAVVHWSKELDGYCFAYCSNWQQAAEVIKTGKLNVSEERVNEQVRANIEAGWTNVVPHKRQTREVILLAGGPSMRGQIDKIRELREEGAALITVNGAYAWALEQGLTPSVQIVLDAREFNARFTRPVVDSCRYLIASQCHPSTLDGLPKERTMIWHTGISEANEKLLAEKEIPYFPVAGGSTVVLRAFPLMMMLGCKRFHVFGFDSCVAEDAHHAYAQPENDNAPTVPVTCGGRVFQCTPWQVSQASEFQDLVKLMGDESELAIYGDGLISHMFTTGATFARAEATQADALTAN